MKKYNQKVFSSKTGDCFRACMATVLQLPSDVLPNDHSPYWFFHWRKYLNQFGLEIHYDNAKGAIWQSNYWIASVKSLNFEKTTHAIVMNGSKVFHDPSTHKKYRAGTFLLGDDCVVSGYSLTAGDCSKLHLLEEYRKEISE